MKTGEQIPGNTAPEQKPTSALNAENLDSCSEESSFYEDKESEGSFNDVFSVYSNDSDSVDASENNNYEDLLALDESVKSKGLSGAEIKKFPTYIYLSSDAIAKPDACCVICISNFEVGEVVREISCNHEFHRDCIDKWFSNSIKCPSCNTKLR